MLFENTLPSTAPERILDVPQVWAVLEKSGKEQDAAESEKFESFKRVQIFKVMFS